jgi:hypothetical protein
MSEKLPQAALRTAQRYRSVANGKTASRRSLRNPMFSDLGAFKNEVSPTPRNGHRVARGRGPKSANSSRLTSGYLIRMLPSGGRDIREQAANIVMASWTHR